MPLYFAYGSNMDVAAMAVRCPSTRPLGPARLARHRFLINADGFATVTHDARRDVHGLLFDLALRDLPALDRYEEVGRGLYSKIVQPVIAAAGPRKALVYIGRSSAPGIAKPGYLDGIVAAAEAAGLPEAYVVSLRQLGGLAAPVTAVAPKFRAIGSKARS